MHRGASSRSRSSPRRRQAVAGGGGTSASNPGRRWLALGVAAVIVVAVATAVLATSGNDGSLTVDAAAQAVALVGGPNAGPTASVGLGDTPAAKPGALAGSTIGPGGTGDLIVEVNGAVRHPGLYHLASGSRVGDAISAAGGYSGRIDATAAQSLNLAARLTDGQQMHAPSRDERVAPLATPAGQASSTTNSGGSTTTRSGPVNVNTATAAELEALPAIGPATAAKIIAAREEKRFGSVRELKDRKIVEPQRSRRSRAW